MSIILVQYKIINKEELWILIFLFLLKIFYLITGKQNLKLIPLRDYWEQNMKKYKVNDTYFSNIDTADKAYFLGFLYADGYNNVSRHEVKIRLSIQDEELLIKLRDILYPNRDRPLYYQRRNDRQYCELYICNTNISNDLNRHGCVRAKTFNISFPYFIDGNFYSHFIRGVFDGDGSICLSQFKNGQHKTSFSITGYRPFINEINKILSDSCNVHENKLTSYKGKDERIASLAFTGCRQCIKIREYLYQDANIYMLRKYEKFQKLGTDEWRTYQNFKVNLYERTIKTSEVFNDPKELIETNFLLCSKCQQKLRLSNKIYDNDKIIYCSKCYNKTFSSHKRTKNNCIIIKNDIAILQIKEYQIYFDVEDINVVNTYTWHIENGRVVSKNRNHKCTYLNRLILNAIDGESVAFADGDCFNMRKSNLIKRNHR